MNSPSINILEREHLRANGSNPRTIALSLLALSGRKDERGETTGDTVNCLIKLVIHSTQDDMTGRLKLK